MSIARSPKDRLRALRAGRVSQLLEPTPADGLPPTDPPRITLNGKPVATAGAFDAVLERAHGDVVTRAMGSVVKSATKDPKRPPPLPPVGGGKPNYSEGTVRAIDGLLNPTVPVLRTATTLLAARDIAEVLARRDFTEATRNLTDEQRDLSDLYGASSNDNARKSPPGAYQSIAEGLIVNPAPFPGDLQESVNQLPGPDPDDPTLRGLGKLPPFPGTPPELPENVPDDPEEFNRPRIETIPVTEITWQDLVLYHHSSPETEQDTQEAMEMLGEALEKLGIKLVTPEEAGMRSKEHYVAHIEDGVVIRRGYNFADFVIFLINDHGQRKAVIANTIDTLKDGITPNWRERRAASNTNRNWANDPMSIMDILLIPKSRGMQRETWREITRSITTAAARLIVDSLAQ